MVKVTEIDDQGRINLTMRFNEEKEEEKQSRRIERRKYNMKYIYILQQAIGWIIVIYWLYQLIISACALIQFKEKPLIKRQKT